jgi:hypothetical protein
MPRSPQGLSDNNNDTNKFKLIDNSLSLDYITIKKSAYNKLNITKDSNTVISNTHSFLIGVLTVFIIIFILNPELLLNSIAVMNCLTLNL